MIAEMSEDLNALMTGFTCLKKSLLGLIYSHQQIDGFAHKGLR